MRPRWSRSASSTTMSLLGRRRNTGARAALPAPVTLSSGWKSQALSRFVSGSSWPLTRNSVTRRSPLALVRTAPWMRTSSCSLSGASGLMGPSFERERHAPTARRAAPHLHLRLLDLAGLAVLPRPRVLVLLVRNTSVAAPSRGDVERLHVGTDAEREAQARRHERLVVGRVDLVERVFVGLYTPARTVELGARFVERRVVLLRRVVLFVGRRCGLDLGRRRRVSRRAGASLPTR
jgi:hypothetical protein